MLMSFVIMFFVNRNGVKTLRWIIYISIPLSIVFIYSFMIFGITLGVGIDSGIKHFLWGNPDETITIWKRL